MAHDETNLYMQHRSQSQMPVTKQVRLAEPVKVKPLLQAKAHELLTGCGAVVDTFCPWRTQPDITPLVGDEGGGQVITERVKK